MLSSRDVIWRQGWNPIDFKQKYDVKIIKTMSCSAGNFYFQLLQSHCEQWIHSMKKIHIKWIHFYEQGMQTWVGQKHKGTRRAKPTITMTNCCMKVLKVIDMQEIFVPIPFRSNVCKIVGHKIDSCVTHDEQMWRTYLPITLPTNAIQSHERWPQKSTDVDGHIRTPRVAYALCP